MRRLLRDMRLLALPAVAGLVLAACGSSSGGDAKPVITSAKKARVGTVLVDAQGRTLYRFSAEAQGLPVCTGACVTTWPPAIAPGTSGLPAHVATVRREDGRLQLTYDGHPLYRYSGDTSKADAKGEGVGGQWFTVRG